MPKLCTYYMLEVENMTEDLRGSHPSAPNSSPQPRSLALGSTLGCEVSVSDPPGGDKLGRYLKYPTDV